MRTRKSVQIMKFTLILFTTETVDIFRHLEVFENAFCDLNIEIVCDGKFYFFEQIFSTW